MAIKYRTNYPHNCVQWAPGQLVWHDGDAKKPELLATVVDVDRDRGTCVVEYRDPAFLSRNPSYKGRLCVAPIETLHDPERWDADGNYRNAVELDAWRASGRGL